MIAQLIVGKLYQIRGWLRQQTLVKLLIVLIMLVALLLVSSGIFVFAFTFFKYLGSFDNFGFAVAHYSLNAGLVVTLLLTIVSAVFVNLRHITSGRNRHYLSLPIPGASLYGMQSLNAAFQSAWPTLVIMLPLLLAYYVGSQVGIKFLPILIVLFVLILVSQTVGGAIATLVASSWGRVSLRTNLLIAIAGLAGVFLVAQTLFPPQFFRLYDAENWQIFQAGLQQLPINHPMSVSYWLTNLATQGLTVINTPFLGSIVLTAILLIFYFKNKYQNALIKGSQSAILAGKKSQQTRSSRIKLDTHPYITALKHELLWYTNASETSYLIFIGLITAFLLFIINILPFEKAAIQGWDVSAYVIIFVAISYMGLLFANRFLFPNLTKDRGKLWIFFSAPLKRLNLFDVKLTTTLFALTLWIAIGFLVIQIFPTTTLAAPHFFALMLTLSLLLVFIFQFATGVVFPAKSPHTSAEVASTSLSGVLAVLVSLFTVALLAGELYVFLKLHQPINTNLLMGLIAAHAFWLYVAYHRFTKLETI